MSNSILPPTEIEVLQASIAAFRWLSELVWLREAHAKRQLAWPLYEKDLPNALSSSQVAWVLHTWGEYSDSATMKSIAESIEIEAVAEDDRFFWRNPGRDWTRCPIATALSVRALYLIRGRSPHVEGGLRWLENSQLNRGRHKGSWPLLPGPELGKISVSAVVLWCLSDMGGTFAGTTVARSAAAFLTRESSKEGKLWRKYAGEPGHDLTASAYSCFALLKYQAGSRFREEAFRGLDILKELRQTVSGSFPELRYWKASEGYFDIDLTVYALRALIQAGEDPDSEHILQGIRWLLHIRKRGGRGWGIDERSTVTGDSAVHQSVDVLMLLYDYMAAKRWKARTFAFETDFLRVSRCSIKCKNGHSVEILREDRIRCPTCDEWVILEHIPRSS